MSKKKSEGPKPESKAKINEAHTKAMRVRKAPSEALPLTTGPKVISHKEACARTIAWLREQGKLAE